MVWCPLDLEVFTPSTVDHPLALVRFARSFGLNAVVASHKVSFVHHSTEPNLIFAKSAVRTTHPIPAFTPDPI